ncbi:MAG: hypothetical protein KAS90_04710, partial [Candidatus Aenigmarchaeota archaeon]|nr:hypothetical protein [Candidatus Aenigmarchaeota archaeon]
MISSHQSLVKTYSDPDYLKNLLDLEQDPTCDIDIERIYVEKTLEHIFEIHGKNFNKTPDICAVLYNYTCDQIEHIFVIEIKSSFSAGNLKDARIQMQKYIDTIDSYLQEKEITYSGIIILDFY